MPRPNDTIAAPATPAGTAALAVLRISGADTARLATEIFGRPPLPRTARHADYRDRSGELIDDVVLTFFRGPRSYTGEDALEISCHGNPYIVQRMLADLLARGCRSAEPGEFTQRAFLNSRLDLSQAEAVMDLIHARGERALHAAQQQLRGSLGRKMGGLVEALLNVIARIEAYIDFPDEDLPVEDRAIVIRELIRLSAETDQLLATKHYGDLLRDGIRTVIVGEPNVGKSSLLNRLVGRERALVSSEPGTTRDFIEERITIGGHTLRLIDTAGLNTAPAPLEKLGMEKTRECLAEADLILAVVDGASGASLPSELLKLDPIKSLILFNKSDLCDPSSAITLPENALSVSALTGHGVDQVIRRVVAMADAFQSQAGGEAIAINARHATALADAKSGLRDALEKLQLRGGVELVASDLRAVLAAYGEIVGKVDNERMLDHLFATFCIGK